MILAGLSGCFGSPDPEDDSEILSPEIYSVTGSIDGNVILAQNLHYHFLLIPFSPDQFA